MIGNRADVSHWNEYRIPGIGFEMMMSPQWRNHGVNYGVGAVDGSDQWKYRVGEVAWYRDNAKLTVTVRKTDLSLRDLSREFGLDFGERGGMGLINNYPAVRVSNGSDFEGNAYVYQDRILMSANGLIYDLDYRMATKKKDEAVVELREWNEIIKHFRSIPATIDLAASESASVSGTTDDAWKAKKELPLDFELSVGQRRLVPAPNEVESNTSNWKTFQNKNLGFEVKYPADWAIQNVQEYATGTDQIHENGFAYFGLLNQVYMDSNMMHLDVESFKSDVDLNTFEKIEFDKKSPNEDGESVGELGRIADMLDASPNQSAMPLNVWIYCYDIVIKEQHRYFVFTVYLQGDSKEEIGRHIIEFRTFLKTFKVIE
jgi:hypothetical protein